MMKQQWQWTEVSLQAAEQRAGGSWKAKKRHSNLICWPQRFISARFTPCVVPREPLLYPDDVVSLSPEARPIHGNPMCCVPTIEVQSSMATKDGSVCEGPLPHTSKV